MNKYIFTGNLTKDSEKRFMPSGKAILSFTVAVKDGYGEHEKTEYVDCAIFGKRAEGKLGDYLNKGQKVLVEGRPTLNKREHQGKFYANINVFVEQVELIGAKKAGAEPEHAASPDFQDSDIPDF
jgi:single-strand DNA-binding protein